MPIIYLLLAGVALIVGWYILRWLRRPKPVSLTGKVVIVTGATTGIGRAAAQAFATAGARVVIAGRRKALLDELETELKALSADVLSIPTDIRVEADLEQLVTAAEETFGPIDILVNNAGYARGGALSSLNPPALHEMINTNLYGTLRLTQLVLPQMLAHHAGQIINISSVAGEIYFPGLAVYSATKSAICSFSNCLRRELAGSGVSVTVILPAGVRTAMVADALADFDNSPEVTRSPLMQILLRQIDTPKKAGNLIVDAARYRRREVLMGGPSVALMVLVEKLVAAQLDAVLGRLDTEVLINVTSKFHN